MTTGNRLQITDGTEQARRFYAALEDGYFNVDEMSFEQLLSASVDLASKLNFFALDNSRDGDWSQILKVHSAVTAASILAIDLKKEQDRYAHSGSVESGGKLELVFKLAGKIDHWHQQKIVDDGPEQERLSLALAEVIETRLAARVGAVFAYVQAQNLGTIHDFSGFAKTWGFEEKDPQPDCSDDLLESLNTAFTALCGAVALLQKIAKELLPLMLSNRRQEPAVSLLMVFLKLYRSAQDEINGFTAKHRDFYYRKYLQLAPQVSQPNSTFLLFDNPVTSEAIIPLGAEFSGKDSAGNELIYTADQALAVNDAKVSALGTLHLSRDPKVSPERELGFVANGYARQFLEELPGNTTNNQGLPLLGAPESGCEAAIGIAIASATLFLQEGRRKVSVAFELEQTAVVADGENSDQKVNSADRVAVGKRFRDRLLNHASDPRDRDIAKSQKITASGEAGNSCPITTALLNDDPADLFYRYFRHPFTLTLSGTEGWIEVDDYALTPMTTSADGKGSGFNIDFTLGYDAPPIVACSESIHGSGYSTGLPVMRLLLNPQSPLYPYSLVEGLLLSSVSLETTVVGVTELKISNNHGQLDPTNPFQPFGPLPTDSACFTVGSYEMALKNVLSFDLNLEWANLPKNKDGFSGYYHGYESVVDNDAFELLIAARKDGRWCDEELKGSDRRLFQTTGSSGQLGENKSMTIETTGWFTPLSPNLPKENFSLQQNSRSSFYRFTLAKPVGAFGHQEYPRLLAQILTHNAKNKKRTLPLPNEPYTPLLNRITLNYTARAVLRPGEKSATADSRFSEKILHILPFGLETIHPAYNSGRCTLLPQFSHDGNLYIGISASRLEGPLSLFFNLQESSLDRLRRGDPDLSWSWLGSGQWIPLAQDRILSDSTAGFIRSGIISLELPAGIEATHTLMPTGLYWLRVASNARSDQFCRLREIRTHGLQVTQKQIATSPTGQNDQVVAGSINKPLRSIAGLADPVQPLASFAGRAPESSQAHTRRASERLRHKYRAVTAWDYERLILEQFPSLFKVKCFAHMSSERGGQPHPGRVLIAVLPRVNNFEFGRDVIPLVNAADLHDIDMFVTQIAAAFAHIEVRNALYETVQIRCSVRFTSGLPRGKTLRRLNRDICEYLSPWSDRGYQSRFGWCIRRTEIEAYIRSFDYVEFLTDFSMLHITRDDNGCYRLEDTILTDFDSDAARESEEIEPSFPWSLVCPVHDHFIQVIADNKIIAAKPTGIDELEIGSTFIINGR